MNRIRSSSLLRYVLAADAVASGATGLAVLTGAGLLGPVFGLPVALLREAGLILVPYAALIVCLVPRATLSRRTVWALVVINGLWAAESLLLLASRSVQPTALGVSFVLLQAVVVAAFAVMQAYAIRGLTRPKAGAVPV